MQGDNEFYPVFLDLEFIMQVGVVEVYIHRQLLELVELVEEVLVETVEMELPEPNQPEVLAAAGEIH